MKPTLSDALACEKRSHCKRCRMLYKGRPFRESFRLIYPDLVIDFPCPEGLPWDLTPWTKSEPAKPSIFQAIAALPDDTEANVFLKHSAGQIKQLISENRGGSCQDKTAYRNRLNLKLRYYIGEYGPPALKLQYPFTPPATPLQSPFVPPLLPPTPPCRQAPKLP